MPNRILREGIIESENVNSLTPTAELFYRRLMSKVDDYGRFHGHPALILAACYPLQLDRINQQNILAWMAECAKYHLIEMYEISGKRYVSINNFGQRERTDSKFPAPCAHNVREMRAECERVAGSRARASETKAESESESESETNADAEVAVTASPIAPAGASPSARFEDWWAVWVKGRGTNHRMAAEQVYLRTVTLSTERDCFECTASYVASLSDPSRGFNPENFLIDQSSDHFKGRFKPANRPTDRKQNSLAERTVALWDKRLKEGKSPL